MDKISMDMMVGFERRWLRRKGQNVLDLGSYDVNGNYREVFARHNYTGADIAPGPNVDVVLEYPYNWQFYDGQFDVVVSGNTIEHVEYPWVWFCELYRVLRPGGLACVLAPAMRHEHRYPVDTYRYFPDGMRALADWCGLSVLKIRKFRADHWREVTVMVAKKI
jgi:SAM-dependent methyltransferase